MGAPAAVLVSFLFPHGADKVVVFFQGGSLYPGFFLRKLPVVLPERINISGEKDEDYPNDENKDTSPFSPGEV